ncbi:MAG: hypothetical protein WBE26_05465 [Phycisphaerae bacterium]
MMSERELSGQDGETCPKRVWVMLTLSDDEALEEGGKLPQGLQFHLSRCESCRALAERLQAVSATLHSLSKIEPSDELAARADAQALAALREGARLTDRVAIPDEPEPASAAGGAARWRSVGRYAAAAAVLIAVGLFSLSEFRRPHDRSLAGKTEPGGFYVPSPRVVADSAGPVSEGAAGGATGSLSAGDAGLPGSSSTGGEAASGTHEKLAEASPVEPAATGPIHRRRPRRICRHHSHVEAAMCEDVDCIYRAVILPSRGQRDLGWGEGLFDNPRSTVSTVHQSE